MNNVTLWPQIVVIALYVSNVIISITLHGKPKGNYSIWVSVIAVGMSWFVLDSGGFFNNLK